MIRAVAIWCRQLFLFCITPPSLRLSVSLSPRPLLSTSPPPLPLAAARARVVLVLPLVDPAVGPAEPALHVGGGAVGAVGAGFGFSGNPRGDADATGRIRLDPPGSERQLESLGPYWEIATQWPDPGLNTFEHASSIKLAPRLVKLSLPQLSPVATG